jgi:hypothetical protein
MVKSKRYRPTRLFAFKEPETETNFQRPTTKAGPQSHGARLVFSYSCGRLPTRVTMAKPPWRLGYQLSVSPLPMMDLGS